LEDNAMKIIRAVLAGILGALAMSLAMFLLRLGGFNVSFEALLGTLVTTDGSAWLPGLALHVGIGVMAALVYAVIFEMAVQRSGAAVGAGLGLCHGLMAGLMMSGIPAMAPLEVGMHSPGPFLQNMSYGPFLFVLLHILFGTVVGMAYGRPLQKAHLYTNRGVA
jgi:hypothetical protein